MAPRSTFPACRGRSPTLSRRFDAFSGNWNWDPEFRENLQPSWYRGSVSANGKTDDGWSWSAAERFEFHNGNDGPGLITDGVGM